jgi:hypothetical protein
MTITTMNAPTNPTVNEASEAESSDDSTTILTSTLLNRLHLLAEKDGTYYSKDSKSMHQLYLVTQYTPVLGSYAKSFPNFYEFIHSYTCQCLKIAVVVFSVLINLFFNSSIYLVACSCFFATTFNVCHVLNLHSVIYFKVIQSSQVWYMLMNLFIYYVCAWIAPIDTASGYARFI